jgi:hypothetical protein
MVIPAILVVTLVLSAAETDPYYQWIERVPDGTRAFNDKLNADFAERLRKVNASSSETRTCNEVAWELLGPYANTGFWFVIGSMKGWGFPYRPAHATERTERFLPASVYRKYGLLPLGLFVPVDPTVRVGEVTFGTDKISHFLNNAFRYWDTYRDARAGGATEEAALLAAIDRGIAQEAGILGSGVASSFSYADLEANFQGLEMIRAWCEGGELVHDAGAWVLTKKFDITRWVNPCWDEGWYTTAFSGLTGEGVQASLRAQCPLRLRPRIADQRAAYRARPCTSFSVRVLDERIAAGELPDPTPYSVESVCGDPPGRVVGGAREIGPPLSGALRREARGPQMRPAGACFP